MGVRWIGSKARVVGDILDVAGHPGPDGGVFVDAFSGTGVVAEAAAIRGWPVRVNDHLLCATIATAARLVSTAEAPFTGLGGYPAALDQLQNAPAREGFIWAEYSPASGRHGAHTRQYFTEVNAAKIDGMRARVAAWARDGLLTPTEERLLIADLLVAVNHVANIAGTYGCFLSHWSPAAQRELTLRPRTLRARLAAAEVFNVDVRDVPAAPGDTVYLDPPYTKRQYAAYYHVQETIAHGDQPVVTGKTGLRPWRDKASVFCYKVRALDALVDLAVTLDARRVLLSYSSQGHVALSDLRERLAGLGDVEIHRLGEIGRYRPNKVAVAAGSRVEEYVVELVKDRAGDPVPTDA